MYTSILYKLRNVRNDLRVSRDANTIVSSARARARPNTPTNHRRDVFGSNFTPRASCRYVFNDFVI